MDINSVEMSSAFDFSEVFVAVYSCTFALMDGVVVIAASRKGTHS